MIVGNRLNQDIYPVVEKFTEPGLVAYTRFDNLYEVGRQIWLVRDWIQEHHLVRAGSPSCIYSTSDCSSETSAECIGCEVRWALAESPEQSHLPVNGEVKIKRLRPELVLSTTHQGDTEKINESLEFLRKILRDEMYSAIGPHREIYLFEVNQPKSRWLTELQIPVIKGPRG
jgi:hypothetical protein